MYTLISHICRITGLCKLPDSRPISALIIFAIMALLQFPVSTDLAAQRLYFPELENRYDAVILIADVRTGELLGGAQLIEAFQQQYMPASVFKLPITVAALASGGVSHNYSYTCTGADTIDGVVHTCWTKKGHGHLNLSGALAYSCNLYFRNLATTLSYQQIATTARLFGMVGPSGFRGSNESEPAFTLTSANLLGEAFTVSPAQMLRMALILASRGRQGNTSLTLLGERYSPLYTGLAECTAAGTGTPAAAGGTSIAGKTGTAPVPELPHKTVGWFVGYAPADSPRYAISVMLRYGTGGDAARLAGMALGKVL